LEQFGPNCKPKLASAGILWTHPMLLHCCVSFILSEQRVLCCAALFWWPNWVMSHSFLRAAEGGFGVQFGPNCKPKLASAGIVEPSNAAALRCVLHIE
jgi:hypothetical protein